MELLTGTTMFQVRIGDVPADSRIVTHLRNSVFFRPTAEGTIEPARQSISAILLLSISADRAASLVFFIPRQPWPSLLPFCPTCILFGCASGRSRDVSASSGSGR